MTRKQLPFFIAFLVLLFGAMACACLGSGGGLGGFQATANAALTQASGQTNSLSATANAAATQAIATANAAGGGSSGGAPTATTAAAAATSAGSGGNGTGATGGPSDIPLMTGDNSNVVTTATAVAYQTKADSAAVVTFYKDAMPKNGWTADATKTIESSFGTVLAYTKGGRLALITIAKDPSGGGTTVAIAVQ